MRRDPEQVLDEYLVVLAQSGEPRAWAQLAERWAPKLVRHAARVLGDADAGRDAAQDAWLSAARGLKRLQDPGRFAPWLYAICTRRCMDALRAKGRVRTVRDAAQAHAHVNGAAHDPRAHIEAGLDLTAALRDLPGDQRAVVSLYYGEDLSVDDIAAAIGAPSGTVKSRLHAARETLKRHLQGEET